MDIIEIIGKRKSIRDFTGEHVKEEDLMKILELANTAPSCFNGQQTSLVYTRDKEKIKIIAEYCGGQNQVKTADVFILIVTDYYRASKLLEAHGKKLTDNISFLKETGSIDAGIVASTITLAANGLGYGSTIIGGVQHAPDLIASLFALPKHTFVTLGVTLGVPSEKAKNAPIKPKIELDAFAMEDKYDKEIQKYTFAVYEKTLDDWFKAINVKQPLFSDVIKSVLAKK